MLSIMFFYLLFLPFRSLIVWLVLVDYEYLRWRARQTCGPLFIVLHLTCAFFSSLHFFPVSCSLARFVRCSFIIISSFTVYHVHSLNRWATVSGYLCYPSHHVHYGVLLLLLLLLLFFCYVSSYLMLNAWSSKHPSSDLCSVFKMFACT